MVKVLEASSLTLQAVCDRFGFDRQLETDFSAFLELQPLTPLQLERLTEIRDIWDRYYASGKISEGAVKLLVLSPLVLQLGGYLSDAGLRLSLEENIDEIEVDDGETVIRGRMDMLVCRDRSLDRVPLCVLIVEAKNSAISALAGLPQLLTYAGTFLERQEWVWGLVTNGTDYLFVRVERGWYRQFRSLSLLFPEDAVRLLEVAIAIRASEER